MAAPSTLEDLPFFLSGYVRAQSATVSATIHRHSRLDYHLNAQHGDKGSQLQLTARNDSHTVVAISAKGFPSKTGEVAAEQRPSTSLPPAPPPIQITF